MCVCVSLLCGYLCVSVSNDENVCECVCVRLHVCLCLCEGVCVLWCVNPCVQAPGTPRPCGKRNVN